MGLKLAVGMVIAVLLACVAGCGGGGGDTSSTTTAKKEGAGGTQSKDVSAQFLKKDGSNKFFVDYGKEASLAEREAASVVLAKNLEARESKDFATQCATLNLKTVEGLSTAKKGDPGALCPKELEAVAKPFAQTKATREDTFKPPLAALRVKGNTAYALFHGTNGTDYAFLMEKEDGQWKVGSLLASELG